MTIDECDKKFAEMQKKYIPLVEAVFKKLYDHYRNNKCTNPLKQQKNLKALQNMQHVQKFLLNRNQKLKMETLQKFENALQNLEHHIRCNIKKNTKK